METFTGNARFSHFSSQERNEQIFPSLIYSAGVVYALVGAADQGQGQAQAQGQEERQQLRRNSSQEQQLEDRETEQEPPTRPARRQKRSPGAAADAAAGFDPDFIQRAPLPEQAAVPPPPNPADAGLDEEHQGIKLGLGDFIFYSILGRKDCQRPNTGVLFTLSIC